MSSGAPGRKSNSVGSKTSTSSVERPNGCQRIEGGASSWTVWISHRAASGSTFLILPSTYRQEGGARSEPKHGGPHRWVQGHRHDISFCDVSGGLDR